jgi:hypothetical protein
MKFYGAAYYQNNNGKWYRNAATPPYNSHSEALTVASLTMPHIRRFYWDSLTTVTCHYPAEVLVQIDWRTREGNDE